MDFLKIIGGVSVGTVAVIAFFATGTTNNAKEESRVALIKVERIRHSCEWADLKGKKDEYIACQARLAEAEGLLTKKSIVAEKRIAADAAQSDEIVRAAAEQMKTDSNGKIDIEAKKAALLDDLPD